MSSRSFRLHLLQRKRKFGYSVQFGWKVFHLLIYFTVRYSSSVTRFADLKFSKLGKYFFAIIFDSGSIASHWRCHYFCSLVPRWLAKRVAKHAQRFFVKHRHRNISSKLVRRSTVVDLHKVMVMQNMFSIFMKFMKYFCFRIFMMASVSSTAKM